MFDEAMQHRWRPFISSRNVDKSKKRWLFLAHDRLLILARHVVPFGTVLKLFKFSDDSKFH